MTITKWIIAAAVLVGLIGGATVLYNNLSDGRGDNLVVFDTTSTAEEQTAASTEAESQEETQTQAVESQPTNEQTPSSENENTEELLNNLDPKYDFSFIDENGKTLMLSDLVGKPIVLNFWATWCIYCKLEMPSFESLYEQYGEDINFVMMNVTDASETVAVAKQYIESEGFTFPVYFDTEGKGAAKYGTASGIPLSFFFDKTGKLVAHASGALDEATLSRAIDMIKD